MKYLIPLLFLFGCNLEPKFKIGDCLIPRIGKAIKIVDINNDRYVAVDTMNHVWSEHFDKIDKKYAKINCKYVLKEDE